MDSLLCNGSVLNLCQHPLHFRASSEIPFYIMEPRVVRQEVSLEVRDAGLQHVSEARRR